MNEQLRALRGNLKQSEMASIIGISQQCYSNYESGKSSLPSDVVVSVCKNFGCSAEWLLGFGEPVPRLSQEEEAMILLFRQLNDRGQMQIIEQAQMMVESGRYAQAKNNQGMVG